MSDKDIEAALAAPHDRSNPPPLAHVVRRGEQLRHARRRKQVGAGALLAVAATGLLLRTQLMADHDQPTRVRTATVPDNPESTTTTAAAAVEDCATALPVTLDAEPGWDAGPATMGSSPTSIAQGAQAGPGQFVEHWTIGGIDFEIRSPGTLPVGDGDYEDPIDVAGFHATQAPASRGALHHQVYVETGNTGLCGTFSVHAFGSTPAVDLRTGLRTFVGHLVRRD